jgi:hypothetical protein
VLGAGGAAIPEFIKKIVEPAKAVLVLSNGSNLRELAEFGWDAPLEMPYDRAFAEWVWRLGSSYHWVKTYDLYGDALVDKATVKPYVRNN